MQVNFHPRTEWTSGYPDSNSGNPRPLMQSQRPFITVHYTGVSWHLSSGQLRYQPVITPSVMENFEQIADAGSKSYEYNYLVPVGIPGSVEIWEYAGLYQAAHSFGENHLSFGIILLLGVDNFAKPNMWWQPCSDEMVYAVRWIRKYLTDRNYLAPDHQILPHTQMPEANTACPGQPAIQRIPEMRIPLTTFVPKPIPPVGEDGVLIKTMKPTFEGAGDNPYLALFDTGIVRPLLSDDIKPLEVSPDGGAFPIPDKGQYERICQWANIPTV